MKDKNNILEELYQKAGGSTSCFLFLESLDNKLLESLVKDNYLKKVPNSDKRKMFACTYKLVTKFRELRPNEIEQIKSYTKEIRERTLKQLKEDNE